MNSVFYIRANNGHTFKNKNVEDKHQAICYRRQNQLFLLAILCQVDDVRCAVPILYTVQCTLLMVLWHIFELAKTKVEFPETGMFVFVKAKAYSKQVKVRPKL